MFADGLGLVVGGACGFCGSGVAGTPPGVGPAGGGAAHAATSSAKIAHEKLSERVVIVGKASVTSG